MIFGVKYELTEVEARVLGALVEKEATTPEYYPLSLNALTNACNQKSNREPVMSLDEEAVRGALRSLTDQMLARPAASDGRVAKFEHRLQEVFNLHRNETALLCVLLLRGPQTPGELRNRAERLYSFEDLESVHTALNLLMKREPPLARVLPRQSGTKEARFAQLLSGESAAPAPTHGDEAVRGHADERLDRLERCEEEIEALRNEVGALRRQVEQLQKLAQ